MDGRYYHHYASADRMRYLPEHPGPYPAPAMPATLDDLGISPPEPEPPLWPGLEKVRLDTYKIQIRSTISRRRRVYTMRMQAIYV